MINGMYFIEPAIFVIEASKESGIASSAQYHDVVPSASERNVPLDGRNNEGCDCALEPPVIVVVEVHPFASEAKTAERKNC